MVMKARSACLTMHNSRIYFLVLAKPAPFRQLQTSALPKRFPVSYNKEIPVDHCIWQITCSAERAVYAYFATIDGKLNYDLK